MALISMPGHSSNAISPDIIKLRRIHDGPPKLRLERFRSQILSRVRVCTLGACALAGSDSIEPGFHIRVVLIKRLSDRRAEGQKAIEQDIGQREAVAANKLFVGQLAV